MAAEATNTNAMEIDQGGQVWARHTCPHVLESVTMPDTIETFPDLAASTQCNIDKCEHTESWVCMKCHKILCGRYGSKHMMEHKDKEREHCIAMGCGDLSFWCYKCDDYLDHLHMRRIFEFYKIAHISKFKHEINNLEELMKRTDFAAQDELEKKQYAKFQNDAQDQDEKMKDKEQKDKEQKAKENENVEKTWFPGTELLKRKWAKKDEIEYDSDPDNRQKDGKEHKHKGIIFAVNETKGSFGKVMLKDENGGYCNYGLEAIKVKLPPATPENTVKGKTIKRNQNDLYNPSSSSSSTTTNTNSSRTNYNSFNTPKYDLSAYRGWDENDDYKAPKEYIKYYKLIYRKKMFKKGDEIEYKDIDNDKVKKGKIISLDDKTKTFKVKLSTGDKNTIDVDYEKILIGVCKQYWQCQYCGFENGIKSKQCMVCDMNDIEISDKNKNKRPESDDTKDENKEEKKVTENKEKILPPRFFVYGTLRDDDDSGAGWTASWCKDCIANNGKLYGYKMYQNKGLNYPFAIKAKKQDFIVGRIVSWNDKNIFKQKLQRADQIEGYNDKNEDNNLYHREIVECENTDNGQMVNAVFYFQDAPNDLDTQCYAMPNGDWLQRKRD